jgi:hypothetical protein
MAHQEGTFNEAKSVLSVVYFWFFKNSNFNPLSKPYFQFSWFAGALNLLQSGLNAL